MLTSSLYSQNWWTSQDSGSIYAKNTGSVLVGSFTPLGKLTVGPDDRFYNLSLVGDYNNMAKNYLQIGVTGRGFGNLQGQTIFDLYHSNTQNRLAGYNFRIGGTSRLFLNGEGYVGIGTEKPEALLDLNGGPEWNGLKKAIRLPENHAIRFDAQQVQYGLVSYGGELGFVYSNGQGNPFGGAFSRLMTLQPKKVVIDGDLEVRGRLTYTGQVVGGSTGDLEPIGNTGSGNGKGGVFESIAPYGSGAQDWVMNGNNIYYTYNSGNVGIGTTGPIYKLHVASDADRQAYFVNSSNGALGGIQIGAHATIQTPNYSAGNWRRMFIAEGAVFDLTNNRIQLTNPAYDRAAIEFMNGGHISFKSESSNRSTPGYMTQAEWDGIERMRITNTGLVGIGTSSPSQKLDVRGNSYFESAMSASSSYSAPVYTKNTTALGSTLNAYSGNLIAWTGVGNNTVGVHSYLIRTVNGVTNWWNSKIRLSASVDGGSYAQDHYYNNVAWIDFNMSRQLQIGAGVNNAMVTVNYNTVGIATTNPDSAYKLNVNGNIKAKELYLTTSGWSDFVFEPGYSLRTLHQVQNFITKNGHLPDMPSEKEVIENGVGVIDMQAKLLQKIEELTLYLIEQGKHKEEQQKQIDALRKEIQKMRKELKK